MKDDSPIDVEWHYTYMQNNARYLAMRIEEMLEAMDKGDKEYQEFFRNHFRVVLPDFWKAIGRQEVWCEKWP